MCCRLPRRLHPITLAGCSNPQTSKFRGQYRGEDRTSSALERLGADWAAATTMQLGLQAPRLPACPHRVTLGRRFADQSAQPRHGQHLSHTAAGLAAARRGSLLCAAAKRPNAKKKAAQKGKPKATVKDRPQVPDAAPAQGSSSTRERGELQDEEDAAQEQQHEQSQQVRAAALYHHRFAV
jgi:hypothetical protein